MYDFLWKLTELVMVNYLGHTTNNKYSTLKHWRNLWVHIIYQPTLYNIKGQENNVDTSFKACFLFLHKQNVYLVELPVFFLEISRLPLDF